MIQQQLIEKVVVPSNKRNSSSKSVKCFRLVKQELSTPGDTGVILSDADDDMGDIALGENSIVRVPLEIYSLTFVLFSSAKWDQTKHYHPQTNHRPA